MINQVLMLDFINEFEHNKIVFVDGKYLRLILVMKMKDKISLETRFRIR